MLAPRLMEAGVYTKYGLETRWQYLMEVVGLLKGRCNLLNEFVERSVYFFQEPTVYDEKGEAKHFSAEAIDRLNILADRFEKLVKFNGPGMETVLKGLAEEMGLKAGQLIHPVRLAVSGMATGPGLYEMLEVLGQRVTVDRMRRAAEYIRKKVSHE